MPELSARDTKLVQYLNEAYGKEKERETALQAHIGMTSAGNYKKRLQQHLAETKGHARALERRIKKAGGTAQVIPINAPAPIGRPIAKGAAAALDLGNRAVAAAQGRIHALRGTGKQEKMLKNAKSEYANEHQQIATYTAIEALAQVLSDSETARLARSIRREEERMAQFLERLIPTLTEAVTQAEIPAAERRSASSRGRSASSRARAKASSRNGAASSRTGSKAARGASKARNSSTSGHSSRGTAASRGIAGSRRARGSSPRSSAKPTLAGPRA